MKMIISASPWGEWWSIQLEGPSIDPPSSTKDDLTSARAGESKATQLPDSQIRRKTTCMAVWSSNGLSILSKTQSHKKKGLTDCQLSRLAECRVRGPACQLYTEIERWTSHQNLPLAAGEVRSVISNRKIHIRSPGFPLL